MERNTSDCQAIGERRARGGQRTSARLAPLLAMAVFVAALAPRPAAAQAVLGRIVNAETGEPVAAASVELRDGDVAVRRAISDRSGRFFIDAERAGPHTVVVTMVGYRTTRSITIHLERSRVSEIELRIEPAAFEMDAIVVTGEMRFRSLDRVGFYERQRLGFGRFIDRNQIENRRAGRTLDLFQGIAGVRVQYMQDGTRRLVMRNSMRMEGPCYPVVYLNGMQMYMFDLDTSISPQELEGVEVYRGIAGTPALFSGMGSACGAVVLWTRS